MIYELLDGESNCGVDFGLIKAKFDIKNNIIYLCFMYIDPSLEQNNLYTGVSLSVNGSDDFEITVENSPAFFDNTVHAVKGVVKVDENHGATGEVSIGYKYGLPKEINGCVRFIDSNGALSNAYNFVIENENYVETTAAIITESDDGSVESNNRKTNYYYADNKADRTASRKTTAKKPTTTKFFIQTSPPYSYIRKTKPQATKKQTETHLKTEKTPAATVYHYEKVVLISQVYITDKETTKHIDKENIKNDEYISGSLTEHFTEAYEETEPISEIKSTFSISEGSRYKLIIGISAAIAFIILAACATCSGKKSDSLNNDNKNPDA